MATKVSYYIVALIVLGSLPSIFPTQTGEADVPALVRFENWIRTNAWMHSNITLSKYQQGNGLKATSDLLKFTKILIIPSDMQITRESMIDSLQTRINDSSTNTIEFFENINNLEDSEIISIGMMVEECFQEESKLYPYLSILPQKVPLLLFTWNEEELDYLQDDQLTSLAKDTARRLELLWNTVLQSKVLQGIIVTNRSCLSFESFRRYYAITLSHSMWLPDYKLRIVPMAEQINHAVSPYHPTSDSFFTHFHVKNENTGSITVYTDRSVQAGDQIFEAYDQQDNSLHLLQFGFIAPNNPYHCVVLNIAPSTVHWDGTACVRYDGTYVPDHDVDSLIVQYTKNPSCLEHLRSFNKSGIANTCSLDGGTTTTSTTTTTTSTSTTSSTALDPILVHNAAQRDYRSDPSILKQLEEEWKEIIENSIEKSDKDPDKIALALRFRMEDTKLVIRLTSLEGGRERINESNKQTTTTDEL